MKAKDLISPGIVPLKTSDTGEFALMMMDEYHLSHLPIVNNVDFLGLISEKDIEDFRNPEAPVGDHVLAMPRTCAGENDHYFDLLKMFSEMKLTLLPVVRDNNHYLGSITLNSLVGRSGKMTSVDQPGGVIIIEINRHDYKLSEIAHIIESNDAHVLALFITSEPDSMKMELTLKTDSNELGPILQTFDRYNYTVKGSYFEPDDMEDLKDRYDNLMNFLKM
jgi:CBS domain-containing protein